MKWSRLMVVLCACLIIFNGGENGASGQVIVRVQNTATTPDTTVSVPVLVGDVTGYGIISFQFSAKYDSLVLRATDVSLGNTIAESWGDVANNLESPGNMVVGAFGTAALSGSGALLFLEFDVIGSVGDSTRIEIEQFSFNNNNPPVAVTQGMLHIVSSTSVTRENAPFIPDDGQWVSHYPEPFHTATSIVCQTERAGFIELSIYNILGQEIDRFSRMTSAAGRHTFTWLANKRLGAILAPGIYFCVARLDDRIIGMNRLVRIE
ncbi:MAG: cohesin domain-containing protein [Candidatus Zhuqueibacterota bacterium]